MEDICEGVLYGEEYRRNVPIRAGARKGKEPMKQEPPPRPGKLEWKKEFRDKREFRRERTPPRRYAEYIRLNRPRSDILASIVEKNLDIQWPKPTRSSKKNKASKEYCWFNKHKGHSTEDCV